jgi:hypothetical protein
LLGGIDVTTSFFDMSPRKTARVAGILYLVVVVFGMFAYMYIFPSIIIPGDAATTASNIMASEMLFRIGFVSELILNTFWGLLALALYKLLKPVNKNLAILMVVLNLLGVPIGMLNALNHYAALPLLSGDNYLTVFTPDQLQAQAMFFLNMWEPGYDIAQIFYALFLVPLGYLVYKSGYFPRVLGVLLIISGFGGVINTLTSSLIPNFESIILTVIEFFGFSELLFCGWLLVKGANVQQP